MSTARVRALLDPQLWFAFLLGLIFSMLFLMVGDQPRFNDRVVLVIASVIVFVFGVHRVWAIWLVNRRGVEVPGRVTEVVGHRARVSYSYQDRSFVARFPSWQLGVRRNPLGKVVTLLIDPQRPARCFVADKR